MANKFMDWWRGVSPTYKDKHGGCVQPTQPWPRPDPARPKTQEELAQDILKKYDYCPIHLIKKELSDEQIQRFTDFVSKGFYSYGMFTTRCQMCVLDSKAKRKLEKDKAEALKQIEIAFALSVLKKESGASSS